MIRYGATSPHRGHRSSGSSYCPGLLLIATQDDTHQSDLIMFKDDFMYGNDGYETNKLLV